MLTTKYLELDSTYRDRNINPNPSSFQVKVSQFGIKGQAHASDPVTDAYAVNIFSPDDFNLISSITAYQEPPAAPTTPLVATTSNTIFIVKIVMNNSPFVPPSGYFNGAILQTSNGAVNSNYNNSPLTGSRRICESKLLLNNTTTTLPTIYILWYQITVESPFSGELYNTLGAAVSQSFTILNPTDLSNTKTPYIFIPCSLTIMNYYNSPKYIMYNQSTGQFANIIAFDGITHIASISDITNLTAWNSNHVYIIRTVPPKFGFNVLLGSGSYFSSFYSNPNTITLNPQTPVEETFVNSFIRVYANTASNVYTSTLPGLPLLLESNNVMKIIKVDSSLSDSVISVTITNGGLYTGGLSPIVTFDPPTTTGGVTALGQVIMDPLNTFVLFVIITDPGSGYTSPPIVNFSSFSTVTSATGTANLHRNSIEVQKYNFPPILGYYFYFYEILQYSRDNVVPFTFSGSMSAQNKTIAQEVSLNSLTLPNTVLNNGGRIAFYPYIYIVLQNKSSSNSDNRYIIYSNNPNTTQAIFKVPITDMNQPLISPFVRMNGNGMVQTIKFKQNDDMFVSVLLPNGEIFTTSQQDTSNGQAPNPLLQCSFCFEMTPV